MDTDAELGCCWCGALCGHQSLTARLLPTAAVGVGGASHGSAQAPPWGGQMAGAAAHAFLRTLQVPFIASPALSPHEMQCRAGSEPGGGDTWGRRGEAALSASLKQPAL